MEAQRLYIQLTRLAMKPASNLSKRRIKELNTGIGELRQLLSCAVCCQLLVDPFKPIGRRCCHNLCRLCVRGRKRLMPNCDECSDCSDFKTYEENKAMAMQLLCYKTLCTHLLRSSLYSQLFQLRPTIDASDVYSKSRIILPMRTTQWIIQEGANYETLCGIFLPEPDLPFLKDMPSSLPAETPPTTAATTPDILYQQHMPEQLSITDIELEAAATGDEAQFAHPLPVMASGARMLGHGHIDPQPQVLVPAGQTVLSAGYMDPSWSDEIDLSGGLTLPAYSNDGSNYTTYVVPSNELHMPAIGQVVQIPHQLATRATTTRAFEPVTVNASKQVNFGSRQGPMLHDPQQEQAQEQQIVQAVVANPPVNRNNQFKASTQVNFKSRPVGMLPVEEQQVQQTKFFKDAGTNLQFSGSNQFEASTQMNFKRRHAEMLLEQEQELEENITQDVVTDDAPIIQNNPFEASTQMNFKRSHAEMMFEEEVEQQPVQKQEQEIVKTVVANPRPSRQNLRSQKATIISSVQVKPPTAVGSKIITTPSVVATSVVAAPVPAAAVPASIVAAPVVAASVAAARGAAATKDVGPVVATPVVAAPVITAPVAAVSKDPPKPTVTSVKATGSATPVSATTPMAQSMKSGNVAASAAAAVTPVAAAITPVTSTPVKNRSKPVAAAGSNANALRKNKPKDARMSHVCRCGTTSAPGKVTCRNSRCTCYVAGKSCVDCKCIGCKNPHKDATDSDSDEVDEEVLSKVAEQPKAVPDKPAPAQAAGMQTGLTLVPVGNLHTSQHPIVLMQNSDGQIHSYNIFNGSEPVDPAQLGIPRVLLKSSDGKTTVPEYAYIMPPPNAEEQSPPSPVVEQGAKKFKDILPGDANCPNVHDSLATLSPIKSDDQLAKSDAGVAYDGNNEFFEEFFSNEGDL